MKYLNFLVMTLLAVTLAVPVSSDAANIFTLGVDDGSQAEFSQENGPQAGPGSADVFDDDYYFAGSYGIGVVAVDENWKNFDRAIANNDPTNRLHFNLAAGAQDLTLVVDLYAGGWWDAAAGAGGGSYGTHDVSINFNGVNILNSVGLVADTLLELDFTSASVNAVAGENVIEITRTGGDSKGDGGNAGWIQFDHITLDGTPGTVIPEPSSSILALLAAFGMVLVRRRR
ncbi:MAG: PEP-CTERM sorting domain-containing protein [Verrucomicrobiales bacterium]